MHFAIAFASYRDLISERLITMGVVSMCRHSQFMLILLQRSYPLCGQSYTARRGLEGCVASKF